MACCVGFTRLYLCEEYAIMLGNVRGQGSRQGDGRLLQNDNSNWVSVENFELKQLFLVWKWWFGSMNEKGSEKQRPALPLSRWIPTRCRLFSGCIPKRAAPLLFALFVGSEAGNNIRAWYAWLSRTDARRFVAGQHGEWISNIILTKMSPAIR